MKKAAYRPAGSLGCLVFATLLCVPACSDRPQNLAAESAIKTPTVSDQSPIVRAVSFLLAQQQADGAFLNQTAEAKDSAVAATGYAVGALLAAESIIPIPQEAIDRATSWLLAQRTANHLWRYKNFLPPDLDDTAAAIGALRRRNGAAAAERALAIAAVFALQRPDGSLPTWLIDNATESKLPPGFRAYRNAADAEVMAYFLHFVEPEEKYRKQITAALRLILNRKRRSGMWSSTWYRSDLYATYRVAQAFARHSSLLPAVVPALRKAAGQAENLLRGGALQKSYLDMGFALAILQLAGQNVCVQHRTIYEKLLAGQTAEGAWPAEPIFLSELAQRQNAASGREFIASKLYSTAIIVEVLALLACNAQQPKSR